MLKNFGLEEVIVILLLFVIFGTNKLPELIRGIAQAIKEFKNALRGGEKQSS
jgi:TatA/E family protein of Tat protein translocase